MDFFKKHHWLRKAFPPFGDEKRCSFHVRRFQFHFSFVRSEIHIFNFAQRHDLTSHCLSDILQFLPHFNRRRFKPHVVDVRLQLCLHRGRYFMKYMQYRADFPREPWQRTRQCLSRRRFLPVLEREKFQFHDLGSRRGP